MRFWTRARAGGAERTRGKVLSKFRGRTQVKLIHLNLTKCLLHWQLAQCGHLLYTLIHQPWSVPPCQLHYTCTATY